MTAVPHINAKRPETIDGARLLDEVEATLTNYVSFPSEAAVVAATLWVAATHGQDDFEHATRCVVKSPLRQCGKTRLQEVLSELSWSAIRTGNISPAALARVISETDPPTIFIDEADTIFARHGGGERSETAETLRGLLNAGHARGAPYLRWDAQRRQIDACPTFAMACIAAIGDLPDTIEDRAVVITMQRRAANEHVAPFRRRDVAGLQEVGGRLHEWVLSKAEYLREHDPELPVSDRPADVWSALVAVADAAGGEWPERARKACEEMVNSHSDSQDAGERIISDLKEIFGNGDKVPTATLVERLQAIDEGPWKDWGRGRGLGARDLARLLKPYGVTSKQWHEGPSVIRGYLRFDLNSVWERYIRDTAATSATSATKPDSESENDVADSNDSSATHPLQADFGVFESECAPGEADVADVADVAGTCPEPCERCGDPLGDEPQFTEDGQFVCAICAVAAAR